MDFYLFLWKLEGAMRIGGSVEELYWIRRMLRKVH